MYLFCQAESNLHKWAMKCPCAFIFSALRTVLHKEFLIKIIITRHHYSIDIAILLGNLRNSTNSTICSNLGTNFHAFLIKCVIGRA